MLVFLIGYMGCGKSSIGRKITDVTGMRFMDMDAEIEARCGMTVSEFFVKNGEGAFRNEERKLLETLGGQQDTIIATGGGAPCFFDNMELMNRLGVTVFLSTSPAKLASRLENGKCKRPLLRDKTQEELERFISEGIKDREPFYSKAKMIIACDGMSDEQIMNHIIDYIDKNKDFSL